LELSPEVQNFMELALKRRWIKLASLLGLGVMILAPVK
jgi:hypothetical protein